MNRNTDKVGPPSISSVSSSHIAQLESSAAVDSVVSNSLCAFIPSLANNTEGIGPSLIERRA